MNLLIGGTGFIGTELATALAKSNEKVVSVARDKGDVPGVEYISAGLHTETLPKSLLDRAENVFILIGQIGPHFDAGDEKRILTKLVEPLSVGGQRIFFFSSVLVYGNRKTPASEGDDCHPVGAYPRFKLESESIVQGLVPKERLVIFRLGNVYGSTKNRGFIGIAMQKIVNPHDSSPLSIHGSGRQRRDYILIDDVVGAILAVKANPQGFGTVNIATGKSYSLTEVMATLSKVVARNIPYETTDARIEADTIVVSNARLQKEFGYNHFTPLEEGLRKTLARYKEGAKP